MKTDSPTPDHEELKALLANSFHSEAADDVPPLPDDLRDRIRDQYGKALNAPQARKQGESFLDKLVNLFSQPVFAGAAAALVILAIAVVMFVPDRGFRGDAPPQSPAVTIVLFNVEGDVKQALLDKGFEQKTIKTVTDISTALSSEGRTVIIDGTDGEIEVYNSKDAEAEITPLPKDPKKIATEVLKLVATPID